MQFFGGTAEPKCCCIMSDNCEILRVIGHNRYLDWGNSSKVFGNHWFNRFAISQSNLYSLCEVVCGCKAMQSE